MTPFVKDKLAKIWATVAALGIVVRRDVVEAESYVRVIGPQGLLIDRQRALVERLRLGVTALVMVKRGEVVKT